MEISAVLNLVQVSCSSLLSKSTIEILEKGVKYAQS